MYPKNETYQIRYTNHMNIIKELNKKSTMRATLKRHLAYELGKINIFRNIIQNLSSIEINYDEKNESHYFSNKKIAIYTVIFGDYDDLIEPLIVPDNCEFYVITDKNISEHSAWKKLQLNDDIFNHTSGIIKNRYYKMFPNKIFPNYEYSIYVDGNIKVMTDLTEFIIEMNEYGLKLHNHYRVNDVYKEIDRCIKYNKDSVSSLKTHKKHLLDNGMPSNYGVLEAPIIVREHHNPWSIKLMNEWWDEFLNFSKRDQISLPYVLWKNNISVNEIGTLGNDVRTNYAFKQYSHRISESD